MSLKSLTLSALVSLLCAGACLAKPTAEERQAAIDVFEARMANYQTNAEGDIVSFDLTDRICTNEDLAKICKLDTVTQCKIYGANLKPGGTVYILGGTLAVLVGDIPRAPEFFIRHKIEWLYRLWREPKRIKRQIRLPLYLLAVLKQRRNYEQGKTDCT